MIYSGNARESASLLYFWRKIGVLKITSLKRIPIFHIQCTKKSYVYACGTFDYGYGSLRNFCFLFRIAAFMFICNYQINIFITLKLSNETLYTYCQFGWKTIVWCILEGPPTFGLTNIEKIVSRCAFWDSVKAAGTGRWCPFRHPGQIKCQRPWNKH
jgi:hypothetical protein